MPTGTVDAYFEERGYGWIEPDEGGKNLHVHWSDLKGDGYQCLAKGERVRFETKNGDRGEPVACEVESEGPRLEGTVAEWDQMKGVGRIAVDGDDRTVFVHWTDVLGHARATLVEGEALTLEIQQGEEGRKAVRVKRLDPRRPLRRFTRMQDDEVWTAELAELAEPESWDLYRDADEEGGDRPILVAYLTHTFARLEWEEEREQQGKKIAKVEHDGETYACFNTGLVTPRQEEIFAFFEPNRGPSSAVWPFYFKGFMAQSDRRLDAVFGGRLPDLPRYFRDASDLIFDPDLDLIVDAEHIAEDNLHRFPEPFSSNAYMARQAIEGQIHALKRRARRNYKTAVPQFHHGEIQLLLPLHLTRPEQPELALVIEKTGNCYRGATVLPLQWAYKNARLLTRPDPDWLVPGES